MEHPTSCTLAAVELFADVPDETRIALERRCAWKRYPAGAQLIGHLDTSDHVCFLTEGTARAIIYSQAGKEVSFRDIEAGGFFGEFSAIDGEPRSASVEALTACCAGFMSHDMFVETLAGQPCVGMAMIRHLVRQVRGMTERVFEFSTLGVQNRIHAEILRLARETASDDRTAQLAPAPTHAEIASRISTHREAVTRELGRLAKLGLVQQKGRVLNILDIDRLERMVIDASG
jgi:CRP-like cAMP-binding protein